MIPLCSACMAQPWASHSIQIQMKVLDTRASKLFATLLVFVLCLPFGCDTVDDDEQSATPNATTFQVAVVSETDHPDPNAHSVVFEVDDVQGTELRLVRGETYVFQMNNTPALHPFHISTSSTGGDGGAGEWMDGVTGNFATGNEAVTFVVPNGAPDLLFYQCANHLIMGWRLNIISP